MYDQDNNIPDEFGEACRSFIDTDENVKMNAPVTFHF